MWKKNNNNLNKHNQGQPHLEILVIHGKYVEIDWEADVDDDDVDEDDAENQ